MLKTFFKSGKGTTSNRRRSSFENIPVYKQFEASSKRRSGAHSPIVIVGGGPTGLTLALDLGMRGHDVVVLNQFDFIPHGSKAICFSKRTLDVWNRIGVARRIVEKGVVWDVGKVFRGDNAEPLYQFDLLAVKDQEMPGFINLQQYLVEEILIDQVASYPNIDVRWGHQVVEFARDSSTLTVATDQGAYTLSADWVLSCDGSKSVMRDLMGLDFDGRVFEDNFLIADVRFKQTRPSERWFWFDPPWGGASALLHKQPDDVWRLDFQLGWDIDRDAAVRPENVEPLVRGMIGEDADFEQVWYSIYTFQCRRMHRFIHDNVIFLGDAAHLVSPFGARGCNGAIADVDNLSWKLDAVLKGADHALIETYNDEATIVADENILNSTRSTDFMTPKSDVSEALRNAVLDLAERHEFARPFVNSGRLSSPVRYPESALIRADEDEWTNGVAPGDPAIDAPMGERWLLSKLGSEWKLVTTNPVHGSPVPTVILDDERARQRYGMNAESAYLIRPDQYVAARWQNFTIDKLRASFPWLS